MPGITVGNKRFLILCISGYGAMDGNSKADANESIGNIANPKKGSRRGLVGSVLFS